MTDALWRRDFLAGEQQAHVSLEVQRVKRALEALDWHAALVAQKLGVVPLEGALANERARSASESGGRRRTSLAPARRSSSIRTESLLSFWAAVLPAAFGRLTGVANERSTERK